MLVSFTTDSISGDVNQQENLEVLNVQIMFLIIKSSL